METSPAPWIDALRHSHDRLQTTAGPLDGDQLQRPSYASEWSIAQVLSHIGSQAEIFGLFLDAGLSGQDPPGPEAFGPIWATWNAKSPEDQAAVGLLVDTLGQLVARAGKPGEVQRRLHVSTSSPVRHFALETGEKVTLVPSEYSEGLPELGLPAEAFIRLVYGRLDPAHTPPVETRRVDLDELRQVFPGF